ncbi:MAG: response regulator [Magnetococcales bacterium]|nr:response regulator [Magnetococcales bacterium]
MELRRSEEELTTQGEALHQANEELRHKNEALERYTSELYQARQVAENTATQLAQASRYKSEFLANMSHELRTPLNSLLILARALALNSENNLSDDQKESAQIIYDSGQDLLTLINDILDLAKVESGRMETTHEPVYLSQLLANLERRFAPLAREKSLNLGLTIAHPAPPLLYTDPHKLNRILTNLLANAIKFTDQGTVTLTVDLTQALPERSDPPWLTFTVTDTGIGIPPGREEQIFQAFYQTDGTTCRRHGGTGLGLTIARELTTLLGGILGVTRNPDVGTTFTLQMPLGTPVQNDEPAPQILDVPPLPVTPPDPTNLPERPTHARQRSVLIIEDDPNFARILHDQTRQAGFTPMLATHGTQGLELAIQNKPDGVILDLTLPDTDGLVLLKQLKNDERTKHVPVHVISGRDDIANGIAEGATDYWVKPVSREQIETVLQRIARKQGGLEPRHVLIVEDDASARKAITTLLASNEVATTAVATAEEALMLLTGHRFCCVVLDLNLEGISGIHMLEQACSRGLALPPVIIYSGRVMTDAEILHLRQFTDHIIIKGERSPDRLREEVALFLQQVQTLNAPPLATVANSSIHHDPLLQHKTVLIVDDDMRNIFALSKALRARGLKVLMAQDGTKAIAQLQANPQIDLVIMDIMMPEMDGYTAMQAIRSQQQWQSLPMIALTAKAMAGEREKCLQAGASDYLAKPVDLDKLMIMLHFWIIHST